MATEKGNFRGKHVAVFGGTNGLGLELAVLLQNEGADVTVLSRNAKKAAPHVPGRRVNADVANAKSVANAFREMDKHGTIDIVINAAGRGLRGRASQASPVEVADVVATNLLGVINTTSEAAKRMEKSRRGTIVNVGSTSGLKPRANESAYVGSKWGVTGYTRSVRLELNPKGIAVVLANPGGMDTGFWEIADPTQDRSNFMDPKDVAQKIVTYMRQPNLLQTDQEILIERPKQ